LTYQWYKYHCYNVLQIFWYTTANIFYSYYSPDTKYKYDTSIITVPLQSWYSNVCVCYFLLFNTMQCVMKPILNINVINDINKYKCILSDNAMILQYILVMQWPAVMTITEIHLLYNKYLYYYSSNIQYYYYYYNDISNILFCLFSLFNESQ